jgi:hypothetical protein
MMCDTCSKACATIAEQDRILARDHGEYVRAERDVLTSVRHPFIVQLHWSFQVSRALRHRCCGRYLVALEAANMSQPESAQANSEMETGCCFECLDCPQFL